MHDVHNSETDVNWIYLSSKLGGRGFYLFVVFWVWEEIHPAGSTLCNKVLEDGIVVNLCLPLLCIQNI